MTYNNHISELVGNTPILKLNNYVTKNQLKANIFAKLGFKRKYTFWTDKAIKNIVKSPNKNPPTLSKDCVPKESSPKATNSFVIAYTCGIIVKPKNHTATVENFILITDRIHNLLFSFSVKVLRNWNSRATNINSIPIANAHLLYCKDIFTIFCGYNCLNTVIVIEQPSPTNEIKPTTIFRYIFLYFINSAVTIPKRNAKIAR